MHKHRAAENDAISKVPANYLSQLISKLLESFSPKTFLVFIKLPNLFQPKSMPARENLLDPEKALELIKNKSLPDLIVLVVWMENALHYIKFQSTAL